MGTSFTPTDQVIHDELQRRCGSMVARIRREWKTTDPLEAVAMTWVSEEVVDDQGHPINDTVFLELPLDKTKWHDALEQLVKRTRAFALLVIDRQADEVKATLESRLGTRTWRLKKERHGDLDVLSRPIVHNNVESMGLLWRG